MIQFADVIDYKTLDFPFFSLLEWRVEHTALHVFYYSPLIKAVANHTRQSNGTRPLKRIKRTAANSIAINSNRMRAVLDLNSYYFIREFYLRRNISVTHGNVFRRRNGNYILVMARMESLNLRVMKTNMWTLLIFSLRLFEACFSEM